MFRSKAYFKGFFYISILALTPFSISRLLAQNNIPTPTQTNKDQILSAAHTTATFAIAPADNWTQLFQRETGWTGGDGIYSIALPSNFKNKYTKKSKSNILFLFSDSIIDTLVNGKQTDNGFTMIHNAVAILNGQEANSEKIQFHWPEKKNGPPASVFIPADIKGKNGLPSEDSVYYWLGDGIALQNNNNHPNKDTALAIFAYKMTNVNDEPFGFREIGNDLLLTDSKFTIKRQIPLPKISEGSLGAGIYQENVGHKHTSKKDSADDHYIYIYGVRGMHKGLIVARTTTKDITNPQNWTYYNGKNWVSDINQSKEITQHVSNELSVTKIKNGQYALIYQLDGIQPYIGLKLAPTPFGPFGKMDTLWHCTEATDKNKILVYNAKAHPSLSPKGKLLISYNVNSLDFLQQLHKEPTFYRPRFLMITWK